MNVLIIDKERLTGRLEKKEFTNNVYSINYPVSNTLLTSLDYFIIVNGEMAEIIKSRHGLMGTILTADIPDYLKNPADFRKNNV